jgi:O-antigen ligase
MMVELSVIPLLAAVLEGDRRKLIYAGILAGLIIVAGGGSRATMAFTAVGVALIVLLSLVRRVTPRKMKILGMATLAAVVIVPLGFTTLKVRFDDGPITLQDEQRPAFARAAKAMASDYPLGVGANNYVTIANQMGYSQRAGVSWGGNNLSAPVHNSYLLMRAEAGWLAEIVMLLLLIVPLVGGLRLAFSDRRSPMLGMGLATSTVLTVAALHCNYEYAWHLEAVQRIFFANLAVLSGCISARHMAKREHLRRGKQRARVAQAATA